MSADSLTCVACDTRWEMTQVYANASEFEMIRGGILLCPICGNPLRDTSTINQPTPDDCPMPEPFRELIEGLNFD